MQFYCKYLKEASVFIKYNMFTWVSPRRVPTLQMVIKSILRYLSLGIKKVFFVLHTVVMCTRFVLGFNVETIQHKNIRFTAWDIGCREKMVKLHCHTVCRSKSTHKKTNQLLNNDLTTHTFAQMGSYQYILAQRGFGICNNLFVYSILAAIDSLLL